MTLFHPSRSVTVQFGPPLSPSVVMLDREIRVRRHPDGQADHTPLVIRHGHLPDYDLHHLVSILLGLPGVLPPDLTPTGRCAVPLCEPDEASPDRLLWTITPDLELGATGISDAYLRVLRTMATPTIQLTARQVWSLARALLSVDAWFRHLATHTTLLAHLLRGTIGTELRAAHPLRVRIFHRCPDGAREVFSYTDSDSLTHHAALDTATALLHGCGADPRSRRYGELGHRPLSVGDLVACGDTFYRWTLRGWTPIEPPVVITRAADSSSWTLD